MKNIFGPHPKILINLNKYSIKIQLISVKIDILDLYFENIPNKKRKYLTLFFFK
ncbi:hypothetical protein [Blattabacterium cuenoti]|uniref:hypothetical protein n=1 Tax=Blattabacterium cuenoti TaxID=1653831 RepID=UPI00163B8163|nr:hypothetical protein [Blattabacterium cuenoti]